MAPVTAAARRALDTLRVINNPSQTPSPRSSEVKQDSKRSNASTVIGAPSRFPPERCYGFDPGRSRARRNRELRPSEDPLTRSIGFTVVLLFALALRSYGRPATLSVAVVDPTGAGLAKAYVVVRMAEPWHEIARGATDEAGHGPAVAVRPGLYQVVVLYPYDGWYGKDEAGNFQPAAVEEVLVKARSIHLRVTLWAAAIDRKVLGGVALRVALASRSGGPAAGVLILARNPQATYNVFGRTDARGVATFEVEKGSVVITAVADGKVTTRELCIGEVSSAAGPKTSAGCLPVFHQGRRPRAGISIRLE